MKRRLECETCGGDGKIDNNRLGWHALTIECPDCNGEGSVETDDHEPETVEVEP